MLVANPLARRQLRVGADREPPTLPANLREPLGSPVVRRGDGCFVLPAITPNHTAFQIGPSWDETAIECLVNHVHLDVQPGDRPFPDLRMGLAAAEFLLRHLQHLFPSEPFRVLVSADEDGMTLRFHRRRAGQQWLD